MEQDNETKYEIGTIQRFASFIKRNIIILFLFALSIYFILSGIVDIGFKSKDWISTVVYIFTTMIFGITISSLVGEMGYNSGKQNELFIATRRKAIETCKTALPHKKEIELYVNEKIDNEIIMEQTDLLAKNSIDYEEIFDENHFVRYRMEELKKKYTKQEYRIIRKAINIKKYPFAIFGFSGGNLIGRKETPNEIKRRKKQALTKLITKLLVAIGSGIVGFSLIGWSWANFIYELFQLMLWMSSGMIAYIGNKNFILNDVREFDQERIWMIDEYMALAQEEKNKVVEKLKRIEENRKIKKIEMKPTTQPNENQGV